MNDAQLITARLVLRRMTIADAPALHAAFSDPEAMRYWSTGPHTTMSETVAWIEATVAAVEDGSSDDFAVTRDGAVIGKAGLWKGNEVGVIFARSAWGQGYAQEAMAAVIARGFASHVEAIVADVDPRNAASLRLLERLGFQQTGDASATFEIDGVWVDSVYLTLTRSRSGG
ncbi:GNAT family N-acetyltransferase [Acidisoma cladoniae]|jgi:ribosomal-protein-alanine N-acetyltransferase|uniref:GNAT family N-acetyltransferase n=1 Tax=Acidisoma cladoniae TaxID=3040935 RepID=UPI00254CCEB6|nr:GNAT family N-acetyltransferase [Acidisoma sp. PAMC 29798]